MKLFWLFFSLLGVHWAQGQDVEWLSGQSFDFGEIEKGKPVETTFQFRNLSPSPIVIDLVRTTCGCTIPEWSKTPIEPHQIGEIKVVYDAHKSGFFRKRIKVFFEGKRKAKKLTISGEVFGYE